MRPGKTAIAVLASLLLCFPQTITTAKTDSKISAVFGQAFSVGARVFVAADTIYSKNFLPFSSEIMDCPGLEITIKPWLVPSGRTVLALGRFDAVYSCFEPTQLVGLDLEKVSGKIEDSSINSSGRLIKADFSRSTFLKNGEPSKMADLKNLDLECFGEYFGEIFRVSLALDADNTIQSFSGIIKEIGDEEVVFEATKNWGKQKELTKIVVKPSEGCVFLRGNAPVENIRGLSKGKFSALLLRKNTAGENEAITIQSDLLATTSGGRVLGLATSAGDGSIKIKTVFQGGIPATLNAKIGTLTKILESGNSITQEKLFGLVAAKPFTVEVIGSFEQDQFSVKASLVRINPLEPSTYFCGIAKGDIATNFFGKTRKLVFSDQAKFLYGTPPLTDGNPVECWFEGDKIVAFGLPQIGILGFPLEGRFLGSEEDSILLDCYGSYDRSLTGQKIKLYLNIATKFIRGGEGEVPPSEISFGQRLSCFGVFNNEKFVVMMASLIDG
ncbi:MAG: hypothetical protein ABFD23_02220 [Caldisericales bacterium]|nr:hypothetical protein [bacterium]